MFESLGRVADRYWPYALSSIGAIGIALVGAFASSISAVIGVCLTIVLASVALLLSGTGTLAGAIKHRRAVARSHSEILARLSLSLVPQAVRFVQLKPGITDEEYENRVTELTMACRHLIEGAGSADANYYELHAGRGKKLSRVNRADGQARKTFKSTKKKSPSPHEAEAAAVVERVVQGQSLYCSDVQDPKQQQAYELCDTPRQYRSFYSFVVIDDDSNPIGMLSLNSSRRDGIDRGAQKILEHMGRLLAALDGERLPKMQT